MLLLVGFRKCWFVLGIKKTSGLVQLLLTVFKFVAELQIILLTVYMAGLVPSFGERRCLHEPIP
jgi:hypothetical protein